MVTRLFLYALFLSCVYVTHAQEDSVLLNAVEITAAYNSGQYQSHLDSSALQLNVGGSLGDALQASTSLYLRQYGAEGQLTSVSFRGTTPSHTQVSWKGIDINSQTLGQSDFSSVPAFLFENITLHHGASSTIFGSGAIGGVVDLQSFSRSDALNIEIAQYVGSFGKFFTGAKGQYGNGKWGAKVAAIRSAIDNDFEVKFRGDSYKQNNASSLLQAMIAEGYWFVENSKFSLSMWWNEHDRQTQPIIGDINSTNYLLDKNLRSSIVFEHSFDAGFLKLSAAYVDDKQTYNASSQTNLRRYLSSAEYEFLAFDKLTLRTGANFTLAEPEVSSYVPDASQARVDWFALSDWTITERLATSLNLRLPYMQGQEELPIVPSLGLEYAMIHDDQGKLDGTIRMARSFRFPTLNDLFWNPGGNMDLKPEDGWTLEVGGNWTSEFSGLIFSGQLSGYRSRISEMIIWEDKGSFWSPQNVHSVNVLGTETNFSFSQNLSNLTWKAGASYAFNRSEDASEGNQLAYAPFHKGSAMVHFSFGEWSCTYLHSLTGKRYTEASNTNELDAYSLAQIELGYQINLQQHAVRIALQVNNLWDVAYQNYELRATPGRNFLFKLSYQLNQSIE
ncbi:MAG: TonB-dependent receptor plug domain-containing protein [Marinoscillum sp.]